MSLVLFVILANAAAVTQKGVTLRYIKNALVNPVKDIDTGKYHTDNTTNVVWSDTPITNIKISDKKIASFSAYTKQDSDGNTNYIIVVTTKKTGKAKLSYQTDGKTYIVPITVKPYVSPVSSLKLGSVNLTSQFKKSNIVVLPFNKYKGKTLKLTLKNSKGWSNLLDITSVNGKYVPATTFVDSNNVKHKITKKNTAISILFNDKKNPKFEMQLHIVFK